MGKMTATKEAKRIIVASIQRVATETAIENAVTIILTRDEVRDLPVGQGDILGQNVRNTAHGQPQDIFSFLRNGMMIGPNTTLIAKEISTGITT